MELWLQLAQTFGVTFACLTALGVAVWRAMTWTGRHVVEPVVGRHTQFLDQMSEAVRQQSEVSQRVVAALDRLAEDLANVRERVDDLARRAPPP